MKKIFLIVTSLAIITSCNTSNTITKENAEKYNEILVTEHDKVVDTYDKLNAEIGTNNATSIKAALDIHITQVNNSLININKVPLLNDSAYKVAVKEELKCYKSIGEKEVVRIIELYSLHDSLYADNESNLASLLIDSMDLKKNKKYDEMMKAYEIFQKKYTK